MDEVTSSGLVVPNGLGAATEGAGPLGVEPGTFPPPSEMGRGLVVNESGLPDDLVMEATEAHFVASSGMAWGQPNNFQLYQNRQQGSLLARSEFRTPTNVIDEMRLARDMAERDDDVAAVIREMIAIAFAEEMTHSHADERSAAIFDSIGREGDLERALKEMYREYLICSQFTTSTLYTRQQLEFTPRGGNTAEESVSAPVFGVFHSEDIRVIGNDMFGTGILAYDPPNGEMRRWLEEFFNERTSPARKHQMAMADRATAQLFVGVHRTSMTDPPEERPHSYSHDTLFLLNPRLCHRTSMPKGANKYARPMLTANFALLEAKRLLNLMDYALLQGGSNFIVVAKKGTDERPAVPEEVENLKQVVRVASRSGVIVGDHRLSFEVITPELKELLNAEKRKLLGRKIAMRMLGLAERGEDTGSESEAGEIEMISRVITNDRGDIKRHVENRIYPEIVKRNRSLLKKGPAKVWFPKIVLQGLRFFTDLVLKLRDRGDIARSTAVEAAGFDWDAEVEKRKSELARGDDQVMVPGEVPHSSPEAGPQDNNTGRPPGSKDGQPQDPARPTRQINQNPGETVRSWYDDDLHEIVRVGEVTYALLEEYAATKRDGRVTALQREAIEKGEAIVRGGAAAVPVNLGVPIIEGELKAVTLTDGLTMVLGYRLADEAVIAVCMTFRDGHFSLNDVPTRVARWGYGITELPEVQGVLPAGAPPSGEPIIIQVAGADGKTKRQKILRNDRHEIIGVEEVEDEPTGGD